MKARALLANTKAIPDAEHATAPKQPHALAAAGRPVREAIEIHGARQNNLKNLTVALPLNELIVVTGVSGSGKSSLAFDTLYAEGQRRYVETFSPYARQFLDRMDKPLVDRIDGIPPAIAIDQTNPVRSSRSTVGTMTEVNDYLKLLYARSARLYCRGCGQEVTRDTPQTIYAALCERASGAGDPRLIITFPVNVPKNYPEAEVLQLLAAQGYTRVHAKHKHVIEMVQDRLRMSTAEQARVCEGLEAALRIGQGRVNVYAVAEADAGAGVAEPRPKTDATPTPWRYSADLHCPDCDIHYSEPTPSLYSFNSPLGACESCRGFGRVIGIDFGLIVPDESKSLRAGAVRPWQTPSFHECQDEIVSYAKKRGIPLDTPWRELNAAQREWVLEGEPQWVSWRKSWPGTWYGVRRFFQWLETKAYKMHIRVLLSKYRAYTVCETCSGARLKSEALAWRLGTHEDAERALGGQPRFRPPASKYSDAVLHALPGLTVHDLMLLPIDRARDFVEHLHLSVEQDAAMDLLLTEVRARFNYLTAVGLGYLSLDRQSRTLSGGEVQRINLTTALGTSLANTLFVLDEPSIGLHPRDMGRVIGVLQRLRDAGNTLVVVEHDPQIMYAADRILDMGPGPGERGGEIVCFDTPAKLMQSDTLTAQYLSGRRRAAGAQAAALRISVAEKIEILGAVAHNLKGIDVAFPLHALVAVTGVSGSGKSTLVQDVLYPALLKHYGKPSEAPGAHRALRGAQFIEEVVMVDQSSIGRTTRSNPASYVGAYDAIRALFARAPLARERGYTQGTFSFNSGNGRCPTCGGNGYEHVEMQFLSDVYLRCPDCDGKRFRPEVLEVALAGKSIAEVLELTVSEALAFFAAHDSVLSVLQPLADVGLEYLRLGQPVPTLSGGEAQRLKLAGHLAQAARTVGKRASTTEKRTLFLFDEPTTGLHFDDVAKLLRAFRQLIAAGHSLIVIEHNLEVISAADWIIDLGPEGGEAGGALVCAGTAQQVAQHPTSHTGQALREYAAALVSGLTEAAVVVAADARTAQSAPVAARTSICVRNAREHNLRNIDVDIPRGEFTVLTGVSGSGKSTLAFDIVFAEGQRRYLESLNAYARQFVQPASKPEVDAIYGIPPTVAIEQRTSRGGRKSTVATLTEIYHFLRLLFVKLGTQYCQDCEVAIEPQSVDAIVARILRDCGSQATRGQPQGCRVGLLAPLVIARKGYYTDLAKWARGKGFTHLRVDGEFVPTARWPRLDRFREHTIELPVSDVRAAADNEALLRKALASALDYGKGVVRVMWPLERLAEEMGGAKYQPASAGAVLQETVYSVKRACPSCGRSFPELDPRLFSFNSKHGWCGECYGTGLKLTEVEWSDERAKTGAEDHVLDSWIEWLEVDETCPACTGRRLNPEALAVRYRGRSIADITALPVAQISDLFEDLELEGREAQIARDLLAELGSRLNFLREVGLSYLALDRSANTLSGGEAQRIRLASQLGSNLRGVCYILDEPTIGLHPRDNGALLDTLERLQAKGNTLLVVEHDEETIRRASRVIDLGPGAGKLGGCLIAEGSVAELMQNAESVTGRLLAHPLRHPLHARRLIDRATPMLEVVDASLHNLKHLDVKLPLQRLTVVTGVSGSGKSTLARDVIYTNLSHRLQARSATVAIVGCGDLRGWQQVGRVLEVDQTPIGKTPRSCPATYVGFWDAIRRLYAETSEARMRGYTASRFSFNTKGGRCEGCEGQGTKRIEMSFLPDVKVRCEVCGGARFNPETLAVRFKDKSIGDVLAMSVDEAVEFFSAHRSLHHALKLMQDVGLGYLTLGQQSPTLSGGEAQRIKLVTELAKVRLIDGDLPAALPRAKAAPHPGRRRGAAEGHTLYVLDEPTVGLHMADVEKLIRVLHRLVDGGNTVVVVEHNLDVMADADWIIDLGPEGGAAGGRIVAQGAPTQVIGQAKATHTTRALAGFLAERGDPLLAQASAIRKRGQGVT